MIFLELEMVLIKGLCGTFGDIKIRYIDIQSITYFRKIKGYKVT